MGTDVPIFALPPVPHYGGRVLVRLCNISGAQNLSGFLRFIPGHWALSAAKFVPGAVFGLRLSLPSQLSQCVYRRRGVHCAPVKPSTSQGEGGTRSVTDEGASWIAQPPGGSPRGSLTQNRECSGYFVGEGLKVNCPEGARSRPQAHFEANRRKAAALGPR